MPTQMRKRDGLQRSPGDPAIRDALIARLNERHSGGDTLIVHELGVLQGQSRVDIAVINGSIHGYEIKSDRDTLNRLPGQVASFSQVLDFVTIVTSRRHLAEVRKEVPRWWGIEVVRGSQQQLVIKQVRQARRSPGCDPAAVVQLLWRDEALDLLKRHDIAKGMQTKPRRVLWNTLAKALPPERLGEAVRLALMQRSDWRDAKSYVRPS